MPGEPFALLPWWGYALAAAGGIVFGYVQALLLRTAVNRQGIRKPLIFGKFLLWLIAMAVLAFLSIPALLVFTAMATLLYGSWAMLRSARKEER